MSEQASLFDEPSYKSLLDRATKVLYTSSDSPRIDAEVLLQHVLDKPLAWLVAHGDEPADPSLIHHFEKIVEQRRLGKPIAYLVGFKEFWSVRLEVDENVLIPRSDTETLVDAALEVLAVNAPLALLDLGTGSGAIALALAKERPSAAVTAIDSESGALQLAQKNAELNKLNNVSFLQSHWYSKLSNQQFDLIASNPPYIRKNDPHLTQGDLRFEPDSALIGGRDGLDDIRHIIFNAPLFLNNKGYLFLEHGYDQADSVKQLLATAGFNSIQLHKDLNSLPRCTSAQWVQSLNS